MNLVRDFRAGKVSLFAPAAKLGPPPGVAPAKDRARGRVIELRRAGFSTYEISAKLGAEGTPLNRTSVGEILAEEGFGRLLRHPAPEASSSPGAFGRDTHLPRTSVIDFSAWPERVHTKMAGLLLCIPDLVGLDLPYLVGRPGTGPLGSCLQPAGSFHFMRLRWPAYGGSPMSMTYCWSTPQQRCSSGPPRCRRRPH